jgi:uncharacterized protein YprB with RNaseH-like and TPR domain
LGITTLKGYYMTYRDFQFSRIIPIRWSNKEIKEREKYKCNHQHSGITHPNCFNKAMGLEERKVCFDIEASNLVGDFGIMLSWSLKENGKDVFQMDNVSQEDLTGGLYDARIMSSLIKALWDYDRIITHYGNGGRFDVPFVRARYLWLLSRKLYKGERFPGYGEMYQSDTYSMAKKLLAISSRRQNVIANTIQAVDVKTPIDRDYWLAIQNGSSKQRKDAIKYIVEHNKFDVIQLDRNYELLLPYVKELKTSI